MRLTRYFLQGLLVLVPVVVTAYVSWVVFQKLDDLVFEPLGRKVAARLGRDPGIAEGTDAVTVVEHVLGVLATVGLIVGVGVVASNFLGRRLVRLMDHLMQKVPLVKLLYGSIKDLLGAFVGDKRSFDRPVAVALGPDPAVLVVGFVTRDDLEFIGLPGCVAVYLPQSYNFAGNLVVVPRGSVRALSGASSDVMAFLVSGGVSGQEAA